LGVHANSEPIEEIVYGAPISDVIEDVTWLYSMTSNSWRHNSKVVAFGN